MAGPKPLRVIHVGPSMARGGAEIHTASLAKYLDPARAQIARCVVTGTHGFDACLAASLGVPVVVGGPEEVRRAAQECDVLLMWGAPYDAHLGDVRPPLGVYIAHGESDWTRRALVGSRNSVDHVIAVSQRVKDKVCNGFETTVIPNGVDRSRLAQTGPRAEVRAALGFAPDDFVMAYVGRFSKEKNPAAAIKAAALLPPRFKALLVGSGQMERQLRDLAAQALPGRHAFAKATDDVGNYYAAADCLVACSAEEGSSLTIIEAMFAGLPVIATAVGAVPEMQAEEGWELFKVVDGSPEAVARHAEAMMRWEDYGAELAASARDYAERHCYARQMAGRYADLLCRLWASRAAFATGNAQ